MNGAVFYFWFQVAQNVAEDRHLGEFSDAEIAARQAVKTPRASMARRLIAATATLFAQGAVLPSAPASAR